MISSWWRTAFPVDARARQVLLIAGVFGVVIGTVGQFARDVHPALLWFSALGGPWLVTAFAAGALMRRRRSAAICGAAALASGTAVYYASMLAKDGGDAARYALVVGGAWIFPAALVGGVFGGAGWLWRRGAGHLSLAGAALLCGALAAEAVVLKFTWDAYTAAVVCGGQMVAALVMLLLTVRSARSQMPVVMMVSAAAAACVAGEVMLRAALRLAGWGGL